MLYSTVYKIKSLVSTFNLLDPKADNKDVRNKAAKRLDFTQMKQYLDIDDRFKNQGIAYHHQGMWRVDGDAASAKNGDFLLSANAEPPDNGYVLIIEDAAGTGAFLDIDDGYTHPGGIQLCKNLLAVGLEAMDDSEQVSSTEKDRSRIRFFNMEDPSAPEEYENLYMDVNMTGHDRASAIGMTYIHNRWLMAVRAETTIKFYSNESLEKGVFSFMGSLKINDSRIEDSDKRLKQFQGISLYLGMKSADERDSDIAEDDDKNCDVYLFGMPDGSDYGDKLWLFRLSFNEDFSQVLDYKYENMIHFERKDTGPRFCHASCISFLPANIDAIGPAYDGSAAEGRFVVYSASSHIDEIDNQYIIRCNYWED